MIQSSDLKGIWPALVTPFTEEGEFNRKAVRRLVQHVLDGGVHGVFAGGSQGEFYALSDDERVSLAEAVLEEVGGRVPVCIGTGAVTTGQAIRCTERVSALGANVISVITPFFIRPSADELVEHFRRVAGSTDKPILLYNNPARTGVTISPDTIDRLASAGNVVGIKDSSGDLSLLAEYIERAWPGFRVFVGTDTLIFAALAIGACGAVSATANIVPHLAVEIYEAAVKGDYDRARLVQQRLSPLRRAFNLGTFPAVIKEALNLVGVNVGAPRAPVGTLGETERHELARVLNSIKYGPLQLTVSE